MISNCYIHIPFCEKICSYCDFCKMFYNEKIVDQYLNELEREISSIYRGEVLDTIYIGGGTPSSLSVEQLKRLFSITNKLNTSGDCEFTIEANFENTTFEKLQLFKNSGINRLSFGLETINKDGLGLLERNFTEEKVINVIKMAKEMGFNNINVDLMYALPKETIEDLEKDLDFIFSLDVEHVSCYSLIVEEHTKLAINNTSNIDEDLDFDMYNTICDKMADKEYVHYEISNYSKEGYFSKHNLCYWKNKEYYGFGLGASSYIDNRRINNTRSINKYLEGKYVLNFEELGKEDLFEYEVMLNLRKKDGIDLDKIYDKYGMYLNYDWLVKLGLLEKCNNRLFIPEDKWYISNEIIVRLLEGE